MTQLAIAVIGIAFVWCILEARFIAKVVKKKGNQTQGFWTERMGGGAVADTVLIGALLIGFFLARDMAIMWPVLVSAAVLSLIALVKEMRGVPPGFSAIMHGAAVIFGLWSIHQTHPLNLYHVLCGGVAWWWLIRMYERMASFDGLVSGVSMMLAILMTALAWLIWPDSGLIYYAWLLLGACAGFFMISKPPAFLHLGSIGAVVLAYMMGWAALKLVVFGYLWPILLAFGFVYLDDTLAFFRFLAERKRKKIVMWSPGYVIALTKGKPMFSVLLDILLAHMGLVVFAYAYVMMPHYHLLAISFSVIVMAGLYVKLIR